MSTRSGSATIARRVRRSGSRRCRAGSGWRSNASRSARRRQARLAATAAGHRYRPRRLDHLIGDPRLRRRAGPVRDVRPTGHDRRRRAVSADTPIRVVGTAGHVDHGKSTLIRALTGIDPDRLREERERGMTIDLGFAWLTLPGGADVGIVDVPGHQDFIRNMLAGVGGIDAVVLVVAADEGVMPQTREHLAILELLGIERGVVALTKRDLVDDEWAALVRGEVRAAIAATPLASAPLVDVSATTRSGLDELLAALEAVLGAAPARRDLARPRLPIDRAFTMTGFGTVVTGTLVDGSLRAGDDLVRVHAGTAEAIARVSVLEGRTIEPGRSGWVQLHLAEPLVVAVHDRFVVRRPSPSETLGGGSVADTTGERTRTRADAAAAL